MYTHLIFLLAICFQVILSRIKNRPNNNKKVVPVVGSDPHLTVGEEEKGGSEVSAPDDYDSDEEMVCALQLRRAGVVLPASASSASKTTPTASSESGDC